MRFDIVFLVMIVILVAFGFLLSDWHQTQQDLTAAQAQNADLTTQANLLAGENQKLSEQKNSLTQQLQKLQEQNGILQQQVEPLEQQNVELQNQVAQLELACSPSSSSAALQSVPAADPSGHIFGETLSWLISGIIATWTSVSALLKKIHNKAKKYVWLSEEECQLLIQYRRRKH